jgi:hypothetical protein
VVARMGHHDAAAGQRGDAGRVGKQVVGVK